jgi:hypothetical protein
MLADEDPDNVKGKIQQRGAGGYTLCEKCNSLTGAWYVPAFTRWAEQAMRIVIGTRARPSLEYPFNLYPLRVLKQVLCMFFSVNGEYFNKAHPDLVRFVLNKESRELPDRFRIYAFYTLSNRFRSASVTAMAKGSNIHTFSEVTFPPFGFVLTVHSTPPESGFCEISEFSRFEYFEFRFGITMRLPVMPIHTAFPGDYRTRDQTLADAKESKKRESLILPQK